MNQKNKFKICKLKSKNYLVLKKSFKIKKLLFKIKNKKSKSFYLFLKIEFLFT